MANVRSVGYSLSNGDDDEAFQVVVGDLQRIYQAVFTGTPNAAYSLTDAAATAVGAPVAESTSADKKFFIAHGAPTGSSFTYMTPIVFGADRILDPYSMYNSGTGTATMPEAGYARIRVCLTCLTGSGPMTNNTLGVSLNAVDMGNSYTVTLGSGGLYTLLNIYETILAVSAGDTIFGWGGGPVVPSTVLGGTSFSATYI